MNYAMFLDDVRDSPDETWIVMRSFAEAAAYVECHGMPQFISFDHDLGDNVPSGCDFAHWLIDRHLDKIEYFPDNFTYQVHSANPPGADNIRGLLDSFERFRVNERT